MRKQMARAAAGAGVVVVVAVSGIAVASAAEDGGPVNGPQAERATAAALRATNGGTANSVERDHENGATWEVEVASQDGTVDVRLDQRYEVVVIESDSEAS